MAAAQSPRLTTLHPLLYEAPGQSCSNENGRHTNAGVSLDLSRVLGCTVRTNNALCAADDTNTFAYIAGSVVVLASINSDLGFDQRFFIARADALPEQATPSYYNPATPTKAGLSHSSNSSPRKENSMLGHSQMTESPGRNILPLEKYYGATYSGVNRQADDGRRHVKIWRLEQPSSPCKPRHASDAINCGPKASPVPKTFAGRNVLLGPLKDAVFTCAVGLSEDMAVLCTSEGAISLLNDVNRSQRLDPISKKDYCITSVALDRLAGVVWICGKGVEPEALPLHMVFSAKGAANETKKHEIVHEATRRSGAVPSIVAVCCVGERRITVDSSCLMSICKVSSGHEEAPEISAIQQLPVHDGAVLGNAITPKAANRDGDFLTYSENGQVLHWLWDGSCTASCNVQMDKTLLNHDEEVNELRAMQVVSTYALLLAGDSTGVLQYVHLSAALYTSNHPTSLSLLNLSGASEAMVKAHDGKIHDIALQESSGTVPTAASCGSDRVIQIFRISRKECSLQQSLPSQHAGPIRRVEFARNGETLASMSSDRTMVLYHKVSQDEDSLIFVSSKIISLKASPLAAVALPDVTPTLLVSCADRCVRKIGMTTGQTITTLKAPGHSNGEAVTLSRLSVAGGDQPLGGLQAFAGFSSTDGLIRLYDLDDGTLIASTQGQAAVSSINFADPPGLDENEIGRLITTGSDGTVMIWKLRMSAATTRTKAKANSRSTGKTSPQFESPSSLRLVRRILSKAEIARFQQDLQRGDERSPLRLEGVPPSGGRQKQSKQQGYSPWQHPKSQASDTVRLPKSLADLHTPPYESKNDASARSPGYHSQPTPRRASLDERSRTVVENNAPDVNAMAAQLSTNLHAFRNAITKSRDILGLEVAQSLANNLHATVRALQAKAGQCSERSEETNGESFDDYLMRTIDNRLALRSKGEEKDRKDVVEGARDMESAETRSLPTVFDNDI
ncbi:MAG: hypothetical protein Q9222_000261 [Ikaeria aurantiellina]